MPQNKDKTEAINEAKNDYGRYQALESLAQSEGGKVLLKAARQDIETAIEALTANYLTAPEAELRAHCAALSVNIALYNTLTNAPENKKFALGELKELGEEVE